MSNNSLNDHLSHLLSQANKHLSRQLNADGVSLDQWRVMKLLSDDGGQPMGHLADALALGLPTVSKLVDRMVSDGLVHRQIGRQDQRQVNLVLTDLGKKRMAQIREEVQDQDDAILDAIGEDNAEFLFDLLRRLSPPADAKMS